MPNLIHATNRDLPASLPTPINHKGYQPPLASAISEFDGSRFLLRNDRGYRAAQIAQEAQRLVHSRFGDELKGSMAIAVSRKLRPDAGCMRCGTAYTGSVEHSALCFRLSHGGMPCNGRITWRPNPEDWTECPMCAGTGQNDHGACNRCWRRLVDGKTLSRRKRCRQ